MHYEQIYFLLNCKEINQNKKRKHYIKNCTSVASSTKVLAIFDFDLRLVKFLLTSDILFVLNIIRFDLFFQTFNIRLLCLAVFMVLLPMIFCDPIPMPEAHRRYGSYGGGYYGGGYNRPSYGGGHHGGYYGGHNSYHRY